MGIPEIQLAIAEPTRKTGESEEPEMSDEKEDSMRVGEGCD